MASQSCPRCMASRVGAFRYCRQCGHDFDLGEELLPSARTVAPPPAPRRLPVPELLLGVSG